MEKSAWKNSGMEKATIVKTVSVELPYGKAIQSSQDGGHKYFELLDTDNVFAEEMKVKVSKEYFR